MGKLSGYLDILNAIFMAMMAYLTFQADNGHMNDANFAAASTVVGIFIIISIILHIGGLVQMKKIPAAIVGHIIALIGSVLFLSKNGWAFVCMIIFIISAILILISAKRMAK